MGKFIVNGAKRLSGKVRISGSKNAALPLIFATLVTEGKSHLSRIPDIVDVDVAIELISSLGAEVERCGEELYIETTNLKYRRPSDALVSKIRASSYLLGANLARFGICHLQSFGGCNFDDRPIDMHLLALESFGAERAGDKFTASRLFPCEIRYNKISVGATVNALLLASSAVGQSTIFGYAKEPHVISLIEFLRSAGAKITLYEDRIEVVGDRLHGADATAVPDMIEAGTYGALSLLTDSELTVFGAKSSDLSSFFDVFLKSGATLFTDENSFSLRGSLSEFVNVITEPYPGFPTDLQPQTAPLLSSFCGGSITETVWYKRFGYLSELEKFGLKYDICHNRVIIHPSTLHSARATATDLRGGAALLMSALAADGESVIESSEIIKRGYSDVVNKLSSIGAEIYEI